MNLNVCVFVEEFNEALQAVQVAVADAHEAFDQFGVLVGFFQLGLTNHESLSPATDAHLDVGQHQSDELHHGQNEGPEGDRAKVVPKRPIDASPMIDKFC